MTPDYAALDASRQWNYPGDWLEDAEAAGFTYITEMVHKTYLRLGCNIAKTAEWLGMSRDGTTKILYHIGVKPRPKGGRNNTVLSVDLVRELRIGWDEIGPKRQYVLRFKEERGLTCCYDALLLALNGRTWGCV